MQINKQPQIPHVNGHTPLEKQSLLKWETTRFFTQKHINPETRVDIYSRCLRAQKQLHPEHPADQFADLHPRRHALRQ